LARKSLLSRYRQLNVWNKFFFWAGVVTIFSFIGWLSSFFIQAAPTTSVTQGPRSTIYQANRDLIINPLPSPPSSPTIMPKREDSPRPTNEPPVAKKRTPGAMSQPSRHLRRAKSLYDQGENDRALAECDAELRMNPDNGEAASLRKRIARTIQILNKQ